MVSRSSHNLNHRGETSSLPGCPRVLPFTQGPLGACRGRHSPIAHNPLCSCLRADRNLASQSSSAAFQVVRSCLRTRASFVVLAKSDHPACASAPGRVHRVLPHRERVSNVCLRTLGLEPVDLGRTRSTVSSARVCLRTRASDNQFACAYAPEQEITSSRVLTHPNKR